MDSERITWAHEVRRGVPVAGALLSTAALASGSSQAVVLASAAPLVPARMVATAGAGRLAAAAGRFYRQVKTAGDIYVVAGGGTGGLGDGGPATSAVLMQPGAVLADIAGDVLICDTADGLIREVAGPPAALPAKSQATV